MKRMWVAVGLSCWLAGQANAEAPSPEDALSSLFYTLAVVEYCGIDPSDAAGRAMAKAGYRLQTALGLDDAGARMRFEDVKLRIVAAPPDCTPGSPDITGIMTLLEGSSP